LEPINNYSAPSDYALAIYVSINVESEFLNDGGKIVQIVNFGPSLLNIKPYYFWINFVDTIYFTISALPFLLGVLHFISFLIGSYPFD